MAESKHTPAAVLWSALLHLGLAGFLFLTTISCTTWEHVFVTLHLPESWNPVTCTKPLSLKGPVIDATLVGESGAPLPPPTKKAETQASVPPPKPSKPVVKQEKPKPAPLKELPPPPKQPDVKDQEKVVAEAQQKAEQAKREQKEREKQRMAELEAEQREQQKKLDDIFKQLDQAKQSREHASKQSKLEQQKLAQLKDLKEKTDAKAPPREEGVKQADKAQSGNNGSDDDAYKAAVQNAVTQAWLRPDNIPAGSVCPIHIVQIPGGQVVSVSIGSQCPFDEAAKRSVKNAVLRAQPLPYKGYEDAFRTDITLNFTVED